MSEAEDKRKDDATDPGAVDDAGAHRMQRRNRRTRQALDEAGDIDKKEDKNSAAWNRGRNSADPSRKKYTRVS